MSVYYLVLHVLIGLFGDGVWVLRTPSALAGALTAGLTALLALRLFGRRVALIAGLLTAVSLPLVFWGQSARGYARGGAGLRFVRALQPGGAARAGRGDVVRLRACTAGRLLRLRRRAHPSRPAGPPACPAGLGRRVAGGLAVAALLWLPLLVLARAAARVSCSGCRGRLTSGRWQVLQSLVSAGRSRPSPPRR